MCGTAFLRSRDRSAGAISGGGVALKAQGGKIYGALPFYVQHFCKITFRKGNIPMNPLLVLMIAVMILLVYLKRHGGW
jgi:hypothetical protein